MFFLRNASPSILKATKEEQYDAIEKLIEPASISRGYYLILTLSVLITSAGLLAENSAVIIGGMIMAPLLLPILALALSLVTRSIKGLGHSVSILFFSLLLILALSYLTAVFFANFEQQITWIPDTISKEIYILIAICSGVAAAFAWVKEDFAPGIAGIAIAVSLLPPLCAVGIGAAFKDMMLAENSLILFGLNLVGILLGAIVVFALLGFLPMKVVQEKVIEKSETQ